MDLSIIIPVYNVEPYIKECLEPLTSIKNVKFEVIVVDDGSPDKSIDVVNSYLNKLPIKIITQENQGLSSARNTGIKVASGKYIYFYDSDDFIIPNNFQKLIDEALKQDLDICAGKGMIYSEAGTLTPIKKDEFLKSAGIKTGPEMFLEMYQNNEFSPMVWLRIYKREFLFRHKIMFTEEIIHEDEEFTAICYTYADKAGYFPFDFYRYRFREGSISKNIRHKYLNPKSIPSFTRIANHLLYLPASNPKAKEVLQISVARALLEILRRLQYQKQVQIIKKIPSWQDLGLAGLLQGLPLKHRFGVLRYRWKIMLKLG